VTRPAHPSQPAPTPAMEALGSSIGRRLSVETAGDVTVIREDGRRPKGTALQGFRAASLGLVLSDVVCAIGALVLVHLLRSSGWSLDFIAVLAFGPLVWIAAFHAFGLYGVQHLSAWEEFRGIISATTIGTVLIMVGTFWWNEPVSRWWLGWTWLFALSLEFAARRLWRWSIRKSKREGRLALRTLVVGTNAEALRLARAIDAPVRGYIPVGYVATASSERGTNGLPVIGTIEDLDRLIRDHGIECVFVASTAVSPEIMVKVARSCRQVEVEMRVSANVPDILTSRLAIQPVADVMALSVKPVRLTGTQAIVKRTFDLALAGLGLIVAMPAFGVIAVAVRLTSSGPVIFKQPRITKDGRTFTMFKFRTMRHDAEGALAGRTVDLTRPFFKLTDDPRLTRVGRLIRKLSLDELPQLWNVLRGDMSLVGPRPLPADQVAANEQLLAPRHEVRAGITGWWQISGRSEVEVEQALKMDLFYIENWSLALDLYVLLKTFGTVLVRRGAY
jgi:exopolysaccharide biosynthesis polyprenyl glycosylphosphotransferase